MGQWKLYIDNAKIPPEAQKVIKKRIKLLMKEYGFNVIMMLAPYKIYTKRYKKPDIECSAVWDLK